MESLFQFFKNLSFKCDILVERLTHRNDLYGLISAVLFSEKVAELAEWRNVFDTRKGFSKL